MKKSDTAFQQTENNQTDKSLEEKYEELNNKYLRSLADYQNLERQTNAWREDFVKFANQGLITQLLEILDDLENAQEHLQDNGLKIILDKLKKILKNSGLEEITAAGQQFDPVFMEAVQIEPGETDQQVTRVLRKGYTLNGKVIRAAKVAVTTKTEKQEDSENNQKALN